MTAAALSNELKSLLTRAGIENPAGDAQLILEAATGLPRAQLIARRFDEIPDAAASEAVSMAQKRAQGEPIQYVLGAWSFMGREYAVGKGVLIPRDDTEVVVRAALERMQSVPSPAVVDLCAGSGIIAVTLALELRNAAVAAVEISDAAYDYLCRNIALNRADVRSIHADLCGCADRFADESLDLIISNPPYIRSDEIASLQSEVQREPRLALDGGADGIDFYRKILSLWTPKLKEGGTIAFELGEGQFTEVSQLLRKHGCRAVRGYEDIQGTIRAVTAEKAPRRGERI